MKSAVASMWSSKYGQINQLKDTLLISLSLGKIKQSKPKGSKSKMKAKQENFLCCSGKQ
jgi:hypothetical protein